MSQEIFDRFVLADELHRSFFADAGDSRHVVGTVTHQCQDIYHLLGPLDIPPLLDFRHAEDLDSLAHAGGFVEKSMLGNQLTEVFVWRDHEGIKSLLLRALDERDRKSVV